MSQSPASTADPSGRLRATAAPFTPNPTNDSPVQAINDGNENLDLKDDSPPSSMVSETLGDDVVEMTNCALCTSLSHRLPCCQNLTAIDQESCPHCIQVHNVLADKDKKHHDELTALSAKLVQLEKETPEEKFSRLCAARNAKIEALKKAVEDMHKAEVVVGVEIKQKEGELRMLEGEIKKVLPAAAEFTIREERKGKRK